MNNNHAKTKPVKDWVGLQVRISNGIRQQLFDSAASNKVSMNAELVNRLEQSFLRDDGPVDETTASLFQAFRRVIRKIEQITGQRWHADRACYEAVSRSIEAIYSDFLPSFNDEEAVFQVSSSIADQQKKIDGVLDMLENWGAISEAIQTYASGTTSKRVLLHSRTRPKSFADVIAADNLSSESRDMYITLLSLGRRALVPLDSPTDQWELTDNSGPAAPNIAVGARALMAGLVRLKDELDRMKAELKRLCAPNDAAKKQGKLIAEQIRGFRTVSSMLEPV